MSHSFAFHISHSTIFASLVFLGFFLFSFSYFFTIRIFPFPMVTYFTYVRTYGGDLVSYKERARKKERQTDSRQRERENKKKKKSQGEKEEGKGKRKRNRKIFRTFSSPSFPFLFFLSSSSFPSRPPSFAFVFSSFASSSLPLSLSLRRLETIA